MNNRAGMPNEPITAAVTGSTQSTPTWIETVPLGTNSIAPTSTKPAIRGDSVSGTTIHTAPHAATTCMATTPIGALRTAVYAQAAITIESANRATPHGAWRSANPREMSPGCLPDITAMDDATTSAGQR